MPFAGGVASTVVGDHREQRGVFFLSFTPQDLEDKSSPVSLHRPAASPLPSSIAPPCSGLLLSLTFLFFLGGVGVYVESKLGEESRIKAQIDTAKRWQAKQTKLHSPCFASSLVGSVMHDKSWQRLIFAFEIALYFYIFD